MANTGFPDATNTGVPAGVALTLYNGNLVINTPGAVISGLDIQGDVYINAPNVTLQDCKVTSNKFNVVQIATGITGAVVQNCEINGVGTGNDGDNGIDGQGTFIGNNIYNVENGITLEGDNSLIQDNYIHGLLASGSPHYDGIQIDGSVSNASISHNTVINSHDQTSAVMIDNYFGPISNITVDNNLLVGGGYTIYVDGHFNSNPITGVAITNNHMGSGQWGIINFNGTSPVYTGNVNFNGVENPAPPAATTADIILRNGTTGTYEIYNIGNNAILAGYKLGQVGTDWAYVTLGNFFSTDTTDLLLRNSKTGGFEVYDISNNNITNAAFLGNVGLDWQVMGFGNFSSFGETDMMLRNVNTGGVEVYDISNNQITGAAFMGTVGLNWQFSGIGNFSGRGESDTLLRNSNTGGLQVYDINSNQITGSAFIGTVGLDWQFSGVGNFSSVPGESDLLLRNSKTGGLEVYNINNNQLIGAAFIGTVGLDWQFAGVAPIRAAGASDLVLRNVNTSAFQVYNIANNQLTTSASLGQVGLDWQLGGFAPTGSMGSMGSSGGPLDSSSQPAAMDGSTSQLVQAMAGFGGGGAAISNTAPLGTETSQQPLLTTPQHA